MKNEVLNRTVKNFVEHILTFRRSNEISVEKVNSYPIPGKNRGSVIVVNLISEFCLEEEEKFEIEERIKFHFRNQKASISYRAPFSSTSEDIILVNFKC